eukprot:m.32335 g.32335  ORF g.32335 m.32335 type:complete len:189 (-) comp12422_c0_seq3:2634-3200(-)
MAGRLLKIGNVATRLTTRAFPPTMSGGVKTTISSRSATKPSNDAKEKVVVESKQFGDDYAKAQRSKMLSYTWGAGLLVLAIFTGFGIRNRKKKEEALQKQEAEAKKEVQVHKTTGNIDTMQDTWHLFAERGVHCAAASCSAGGAVILLNIAMEACAGASVAISCNATRSVALPIGLECDARMFANSHK